jgi:hypothetical protein
MGRKVSLILKTLAWVSLESKWQKPAEPRHAALGRSSNSKTSKALIAQRLVALSSTRLKARTSFQQLHLVTKVGFAPQVELIKCLTLVVTCVLVQIR